MGTLFLELSYGEAEWLQDLLTELVTNGKIDMIDLDKQPAIELLEQLAI